MNKLLGGILLSAVFLFAAGCGGPYSEELAAAKTNQNAGNLLGAAYAYGCIILACCDNSADPATDSRYRKTYVRAAEGYCECLELIHATRWGMYEKDALDGGMTQLISAWYVGLERVSKRDDGIGLMRRGQKALMENRLADALAAFGELTRKEPDNAEAFTFLGKAQLLAAQNEQDYDKWNSLSHSAANSLFRACEISSDYPWPFVLLYRVLMERGDYDGAIGHLNAALEEDDGYDPALVEKAAYFLLQGDTAGAEATIAKVLDSEALSARGYLVAAKVFEETKDLARAAKFSIKAYEADPNDVECMLLCARLCIYDLPSQNPATEAEQEALWAALNERHRMRLELCNAVLSKTPDCVEAYYCRAESLKFLKLGDCGVADYCKYADLYEASGAPDAYYTWMRTSFEISVVNYDESLRCFIRCLEAYLKQEGKDPLTAEAGSMKLTAQKETDVFGCMFQVADACVMNSKNTELAKRYKKLKAVFGK